MSEIKKDKFPAVILALFFGIGVGAFLAHTYYSTSCKIIDSGLHCYHSQTDTLYEINKKVNL